MVSMKIVYFISIQILSIARFSGILTQLSETLDNVQYCTNLTLHYMYKVGRKKLSINNARYKNDFKNFSFGVYASNKCSG